MKAKDLIRKLLATDVTERLGCLRNGAEDVKTHRWFGRMNWDNVYDCKTTSPFVPDVRCGRLEGAVAALAPAPRLAHARACVRLRGSAQHQAVSL